MTELELKYGCNPNQKPSRIFMKEGELPIRGPERQARLHQLPGRLQQLAAGQGAEGGYRASGGGVLQARLPGGGGGGGASFRHPEENLLRGGPGAFSHCHAPTPGQEGRTAVPPTATGWPCPIPVTRPRPRLLAREVSDGIIAPDYTEKALEILKTKRKGTYNVVKIDPAYVPAPVEQKDVFGITFEQGRNEVKITGELFRNLPTANKDLPEKARRDLIIALIALKYTQSNSVCYVKDGQAIGIGAGQQSRIYCTRLAGNKADAWYLRQHPKVLALPFKESIRRPDRDNTIDSYISDDYMDVLADGVWEQFFTEKPEVLTREERRAWLDGLTGVALGSDAFFPFGDNIERARKSGVCYIAQPGGSIRDDNVIETCDKYGMAMAFTGVRLFHH